MYIKTNFEKEYNNKKNLYIMSSMARFQENMKKLRESPETSRAGLKWEDTEDDKVLNMLKNKNTYVDIAKELKRTANSIKTRAIMNAIKMIEEDGKDKETVMKDFDLSDTDIKEYKEKKQQRDEQQKAFSNTILYKNVNNPTIKDNYQVQKEFINKFDERLDTVETMLKILIQKQVQNKPITDLTSAMNNLNLSLN